VNVLRYHPTIFPDRTETGGRCQSPRVRSG
jgi:hypothetical protein